jgi:peptidoglycan/xylan/chitin deacetylase (PgdA/CDA1 family)
MTPDSPGARTPAVVHVDLDGASHIYRHHGWAWPFDDDPLFESGMEHLLAFLEREGLRATLFTIASELASPRRRALLEQAVAAGHEIASHSLTHAEFDELDPTRKRAELTESRQRL